VLYVDDHATSRRLIQANLQRSGLMCDVAPDGQEALRTLRRARADGSPYAVAVIDMHMPGPSGLEVAQIVTADRGLSDTPIVLMTSLADRLATDLSRELGVVESLMKPVRRNALYEAIANATQPSARGPAAVNTPIPAARTGAVSPSAVRILVAEDNLVNQRVVLGFLAKLGYRAEAVRNGQEAVDAVEARFYDLVIMDCQMPELDGFEATRRIRLLHDRRRAAVPIVALTANAMQGDKERCLEVGMNDYVTKPVDVGRLSAAIQRWVAANVPMVVENV
jgi:CheY-like chemotaxis protein